MGASGGHNGGVQRIGDGNSRDLEGWQRLIRARAVLGEMDKARAAYTSAQKQFKTDSQAMAALAQSAKQLGIE